MKRISFIVMALALLVALSQCKKEQNAQTHETVAITLDIRNGGTRMDVNTVTGEVDYEAGDVIYVVSSGKYIGMLTHNGTNFSGPITNPTVGEPLHFYFLGNVTPAETLTAGTTESCSVVISDQTTHLPVIEYAPSDENYTAGATAFTAFLLNKCALVKFNVTTSSEAATCITGMKNKVTVDFSRNTLNYSQEGNGVIVLPEGSGEKWAILLPQQSVEAGEVGSAYSIDDAYIGTRGAIPAILENGYLNAGVLVVTTNEVNPTEFPIGAINGKFTINSNGNHVCFSKGNLQYIGSAATPYWKFADSQWDYLGNNGQGSENQDVDRDLFGWGTSGYQHRDCSYEPWSTSTDYSEFYAYGMYSYNLYDQTGMADWGYNAISNGGNVENSGWRTLRTAEWEHLFLSRNTISGIRFAKAKVNNVNGVILLPDNWTATTYMLNNTNNIEIDFTSNIVNNEDWISIFETNGAVFLPTASRRYGTVVYGANNGYYWSSSFLYSGYANYLYFGANNIGPQNYDDISEGLSVRLVRDVQ